jgi:hypothetical protein
MSHWAATLTVRTAEGGRLFLPWVLIQGRDGFPGGTLRVELLDERGVVRRTARRPLVPSSLGRELAMPSFTAPEPRRAAAVLGWPWEIVVESDGRELVRWRRYLAEATSINPEAEIDLRASGDPRRAKEEAEGKGPEAPWSERDSERLLAVLVDEGEITERDRESALARRGMTGRTVERVLIEKGWVDERELLETYAELTGTELVDLDECSIDPEAASLVPDEIALRHGLIAIGFRGDDLLTVAMCDPQDPRAVVDIEAATWRRVYIVVATRAEILTALEDTLGPSRVLGLAELSCT